MMRECTDRGIVVYAGFLVDVRDGFGLFCYCVDGFVGRSVVSSRMATCVGVKCLSELSTRFRLGRRDEWLCVARSVSRRFVVPGQF